MSSDDPPDVGHVAATGYGDRHPGLGRGLGRAGPPGHYSPTLPTGPAADALALLDALAAGRLDHRAGVAGALALLADAPECEDARRLLALAAVAGADAGAPLVAGARAILLVPELADEQGGDDDAGDLRAAL